MSSGLKIFVAELETSHWTFHTFGRSEEEARAMMRKAWKRHKKQTGATWKWEDVDDGCNVTAVQVGRAYRDWSEV